MLRFKAGAFTLSRERCTCSRAAGGQRAFALDGKDVNAASYIESLK